MSTPRKVRNPLQTFFAKAAGLIGWRELAVDAAAPALRRPLHYPAAVAAPQLGAGPGIALSQPPESGAGGKPSSASRMVVQRLTPARPDTSIDTAVLDQLNALGMRGGTEPFAVRMARLFLKTSPNLVANMRAGFDARDAAAVRLATHTLKSSSKSLGAFKLATFAASLEAQARNQSWEGTDGLKASIESEFPLVCAELEKFVSASSGKPAA